MQRMLYSLTFTTCLILSSAGVVLAASTGNTGQPSQTCQSITGYPAVTPGNSFSAPGSAFNPDGKAGTVYAGTQPQNSNNPRSVAQYDVACFQNSQIP